MSNGCRYEPSEHIVRYFCTGDVSGPQRELGKWISNIQKAFYLIHLRFPRGGLIHQ